MTKVINFVIFFLKLSMFRQLIGDLRVRSPLERSSSEVGALLAACMDDGGVPPRLVSRPGAYTRTCVYREARFEVLLLNWAPGVASAIHDHGDQHCWMLVLDGRLRSTTTYGSILATFPDTRTPSIGARARSMPAEWTFGPAASTCIG